jgi:hypothetical protein
MKNDENRAKSVKMGENRIIKKKKKKKRTPATIFDFAKSETTIIFIL